MDTNDLVIKYQKHTRDKPSGKKVVLDLSNDDLYSDYKKIKVIHVFNLTKELSLFDYKNKPVLLLSKDNSNVVVLGTIPIFDLFSQLIEYYVETNENASILLLAMHYLYQQYYDDLRKMDSYDYSDDVFDRINYILDELGAVSNPQYINKDNNVIVDTINDVSEYIH